MLNSLRNKYFIIFLLLICARLQSLAQNWQIVGGGFSGQVGALSYDSVLNRLHIGGVYKYADTIACDGMISWDGNAFTKLPSPISNCFNYCGPAGQILRYHNRLFMLGNYGPYNGKTEELFELVNNNWVVSGSMGLHGSIFSIKIINDKLFAFGKFDSLCNKKIESVAVFNGTNWDAFNTPSPIVYPNYWLYTGEYYNGQYYFGGNFHDGAYRDIIRWTGSSWAPLQTGTFGSVAWIQSMKTYKGILYVGGYFTASDGNAANCLMAWDGQNWFNPFPEISYFTTITDLEIINDELYISGNYVIPTDNDSNMYVLARYNGCDFNVFGGTYVYPDDYGQPRDIAWYNGRIYVAVGDSLFHQPSKYLMSISDSVPNIKTIHISDCVFNSPELNFSVFPNPYTDNVTVHLDNNFILSETKFTITNNLGQTLFTIQPNSTNQLLNLSSLSSSIYYLTIQDNSNRKTIKLIKQ